MERSSSGGEMAPLAEMEPTPPEDAAPDDLPPPPPSETKQQPLEEEEEGGMSCLTRCEYLLVMVIACILLLGSLVLVLFWVFWSRKGVSWGGDPRTHFNLHPALMITGLVSLSGFSILLYRISRCCKGVYVKLFHTIVHALAIPCVILGFFAVFDSNNNSNQANFYSIHSWMGFVTMGLFAIQFAFGFFSFILLLCCDRATSKFRNNLVPIHATFGLITFLLAIATSLTGLTQRAVLDLGKKYSELPEEGIIMNSLAMVLVALAIIVTYAVSRQPFRVRSFRYLSERL